MTMTYQQGDAVVQAAQWNPGRLPVPDIEGRSAAGWPEIKELAGDRAELKEGDLHVRVTSFADLPGDRQAVFKKDEPGWRRANFGDWVVRHWSGALELLTPEQFEGRYAGPPLEAGAASTFLHMVLASPTDEQRAAEPMLQHFDFAHLPERLQAVSRPFGLLAQHMVAVLPRNAERTVMLRKLLEGKDCGVRALLYKEPPRTMANDPLLANPNKVPPGALCDPGGGSPVTAQGR